jgi:hypothetical protein
MKERVYLEDLSVGRGTILKCASRNGIALINLTQLTEVSVGLHNGPGVSSPAELSPSEGFCSVEFINKR